MAVTSLLESMPPRVIQFLTDGGPALMSASAWPGWPAELDGLRHYVESVQNGMMTLPWPSSVPCVLIIGEDQPTEIGYLFDQTNQDQGCES
jgi:hypothetical protein